MLLYLSRLAVAALALAASRAVGGQYFAHRGRPGRQDHGRPGQRCGPPGHSRAVDAAGGWHVAHAGRLAADRSPRGQRLDGSAGRRARLTIGPGALVELVAPKRDPHLHGGRESRRGREVARGSRRPRSANRTVKGTQLFRIEKEKLVRLETDPLWLKGFEGRASASRSARWWPASTAATRR